MDFLKEMQKRREGAVVKIVKLNDEGLEVEIIAPLLSHRTRLIQNETAQDKKLYSFLVIAYCLSKNGVRLCDTTAVEELIEDLDQLNEDEFLILFEACQEISKTTIKDVEEAQKN